MTSHCLEEVARLIDKVLIGLPSTGGSIFETESNVVVIVECAVERKGHDFQLIVGGILVMSICPSWKKSLPSTSRHCR